MKQINVYFQAVTKVSMAHLIVEDNDNLEEYLRKWLSDGYCKAYLQTGKVPVFIPWSNIVYVQYKDGHHHG